MIHITNVETCGWGPALRGMRNPKDSWDRSDSRSWVNSFCQEEPELGPNDLTLATTLAKGGPVHAKYRRMIVVYCDITAPLYWWKEFDTYKIGTVANSCSTMHTIHKHPLNLNDFAHEHLSECNRNLLQHIIDNINEARRNLIAATDSDAHKNEWWQMIQLLPTSFLQKRTIMLNYEVLHNIYHSPRYNHKLDEWREFCEWIKTLPYANELIITQQVIPMKVIKVTLPRTIKNIEIRIFADLHIGDKHCDLAAIKNEIDYVANTENCYAILNGDIVNNATKTSVSDSYAELMSPMQQLATYIELFTPIKDKILAMTQGNHENRTYIKEGVDLTQVVAAQLGLEDRYSKTGAVLFLKVGERKLPNCSKRVPVCYSFYILHGSGGGRKEGAKAIRLADMASIIDVDIYIHSHTHLPMVMREGYYRTDISNGVVNYVDKLFINSSAQLHYGGYGEAFEFKPSSTKCPVIYLSGVEKFATASL